MHTQFSILPRRLSDRELIDRVRDLARHEGRATAALVAHLAELDERRLYVAEGCASLFAYCVEVLHLAEGAAYNRIKAARAARTFPIILDRLADGSVHVTAVRKLAPYLTGRNHREILEEARHKRKTGIEEIIARIRPSELVPSSVRKVPVRAAPAGSAGDAGAATLDFASAVTGHQPAFSPSVIAPADSANTAGNVSADVQAGNTPSATPSRQPAKVAALAPEMYRVQFTADAETYKVLCQARELLKHQIPDGDAAAVIGLALKVLVEKVAREKLGATRKPRRHSKPVQEDSRHIPAEVKRQVWARDEGRCAFVAQSGRRCTERGRLEFHHVAPFARGGTATVENIELRCRTHNIHEAEICFGARRPDWFRNEL